MAQNKAGTKPANSQDIELVLVTTLSVDAIRKDPKQLYLAVAMSRYVAIEDKTYQLFFRTDQVKHITVSKNETPYITITFLDDKSEDIGWEDESE